MGSEVLRIGPATGVQSAFVGPGVGVGISVLELLSLGLTAVQALTLLRERTGQRTETEPLERSCVQELHVHCGPGYPEYPEADYWPEEDY